MNYLYMKRQRTQPPREKSPENSREKSLENSRVAVEMLLPAVEMLPPSPTLAGAAPTEAPRAASVSERQCGASLGIRRVRASSESAVYGRTTVPKARVEYTCSCEESGSDSA